MQYIIIFVVIAAVIINIALKPPSEKALKPLKPPSEKGQRSEQAVAQRLLADGIRRHGGKILTNLYIPKESGGTSEIDVLYITCKGLFVVENKDYVGYIFGNEFNKNWTVTLYAGKSWYDGKKVKKYQFFNPVWQNRTHIKNLKAYLNSDIRVFSLITFGNRGDLKSITVNSPDVYVCNHSKLPWVIREIWEENQDVLADDQIETIYNELSPLRTVDKSTKQKHINEIQGRFSSMDVCPMCGGKLVLRMAKKGPYAGKRFYGCSNYPKCKYIKNL